MVPTSREVPTCRPCSLAARLRGAQSFKSGHDASIGLPVSGQPEQGHSHEDRPRPTKLRGLHTQAGSPRYLQPCPPTWKGLENISSVMARTAFCRVTEWFGFEGTFKDRFV